MTTYIVTGHMRHGTSAMMGALIAGGMDAYYDPKRMDHLGPQTEAGDEYGKLNDEVYEPNRRDFAQPDFPRQFEGKLIKVMWGGLTNMAPLPDGYRYILMQRHPEEARQSHEGGFTPTRGQARAPFLRSIEAYQEHFALIEAKLWNRKDTLSVTRVDFRQELVAEPRAVFDGLVVAGWPIADVDAAVAHIDPAKVRFKLEELEVGV